VGPVLVSRPELSRTRFTEVAEPAALLPTPGRAFVALSRTNYLALSPGHAERFRRAWGGEVELLDSTAEETRARGMARLVSRAGRYGAIVLDGSVGLRRGYVDQFAAGIIGHRRKGPSVVIGDCTWKRGISALDRLACLAGIRAIDSPKVTYCVLSTDELDLFPRTWGIDPSRVAFTPFCHTLRAHELAAPVTRGGGVFAGGDSLRDYGSLVDAARGLDGTVTIASSELACGVAVPLPENVNYVGRIPYTRFTELIRLADAVAVPIMTAERAAGITVYLNAMGLGKLVVVTDAVGVRDYIEDRRTGLIVPLRDAAAMRAALEWAIDPSNRQEADRIAARAREVALERFSPDGYVANLLGVARRAFAASDASAPP
jgi:hypothetical protein